MRSLLLASLLALGCTTDTGNTPADMTTVFPPGPDMAGGPCTDGVLNNDETDVDCGGACGPCDTAKGCKLGRDCQSGSCTNRACDAPSCSDAIKNGKETDVDCGGGACPGCDNGKPCTDGTDCKSMTCKNATCAPSPCSNGVKDGMETDVDCGGPTCAKCKDGQMCTDGSDCVGAICNNAVCKSPVMCAAGTGNCDGNAANGCEVNLNTDAKNCGGCGMICAMGTPLCSNGKCTPRRNFAFVSSVLYDGSMGGLAGADLKCTTIANAAGLPGTYKAWLSDSSTNAADRLSHSNFQYVLVDGTVVATNWAGLTSGNLLHAIDLTEKMGLPPVSNGTQCGDGGALVWTGTGPSGVKQNGPSFCLDWTNNGNAGASFGHYTGSDLSWSQWCSSSSTCSAHAPIYCIQQ